ncbi:MAG TPA: ABC transporter ATP-binding protein [Pirellulaceae bacterium]
MNEIGEHSAAVELRGVSKRFGSRVVLDNIDLMVGRGEVLALLGASGSGKSTLLKIVSGIETVDAGRIFLAGRDCTADPAYRRGVHTVFQNYALFPHLDVAANVAFPLKVAGISNGDTSRLVAQALEWVKLENHARRRVNSLSGGERQRVALARALVDSPECVLLDEPLSALDPHLRSGTLELLQSIQAELQTTFLFITHDREEALRLGHRIGILHQGRLEQIGTPEDVYRRPRTAYAASFIGKINWMKGQVVELSPTRCLTVCGQRVTGNIPGEMAVGDVQVGIRPEDVCLVKDGGLPAEVVGRQFLGDCVVLTLRSADGTIVCADQRAPYSNAAPGECVQIGWEADAVHVFDVDSAETGS